MCVNRTLDFARLCSDKLILMATSLATGRWRESKLQAQFDDALRREAHLGPWMRDVFHHPLPAPASCSQNKCHRSPRSHSRTNLDADLLQWPIHSSADLCADRPAEICRLYIQRDTNLSRSACVDRRHGPALSHASRLGPSLVDHAGNPRQAHVDHPWNLREAASSDVRCVLVVGYFTGTSATELARRSVGHRWLWYAILCACWPRVSCLHGTHLPAHSWDLLIR